MTEAKKAFANTKNFFRIFKKNPGIHRFFFKLHFLTYKFSPLTHSLIKRLFSTCFFTNKIEDTQFT